METVKRYDVVNQATGEVRGFFYNQAPATLLAKNLSRYGSKVYVVDERTFTLVSSCVVRKAVAGKVIKCSS
jgi:hypothetical protein